MRRKRSWDAGPQIRNSHQSFSIGISSPSLPEVIDELESCVT
jgi:hypothetical protein